MSHMKCEWAHVMKIEYSLSGMHRLDETLREVLATSEILNEVKVDDVSTALWIKGQSTKTPQSANYLRVTSGFRLRKISIHQVSIHQSRNRSPKHRKALYELMMKRSLSYDLLIDQLRNHKITK